MRNTILSLCDVTGIMVQPWLDAGYEAVLVDPQHEGGITVEGPVTKVGHVIDAPETWDLLRDVLPKVAFVAGFPVCTDLAVSGAAHWARKREDDIHFQARAMQLVHECRVIGELSGAPYFFENPVSALSSIYRKPDYRFHPFQYGGYLPEDDEHPYYPEYIPPRDAYKKTTCLWVGGGFKMPPPKPVEPLEVGGQGGSNAHNKLGGRSEKTKNIRSATPRGFAQAVFEFNQPRFPTWRGFRDTRDMS